MVEASTRTLLIRFFSVDVQFIHVMSNANAKLNLTSSHDHLKMAYTWRNISSLTGNST
jgi:hypothetical protein